MTNPSIGTFCDHFDQGAVNTRIWTAPSGGSLAAVGMTTIPTAFSPSPAYEGISFPAEISIPTLNCMANGDDNLVGVYSNNAYDLTGSGISFEFASFSVNGSYQGFFMLTSASGAFYWNFQGSSLYADYPTGSTFVGSIPSASYQFLRIREDSGTTYFDTSKDGVSWVNAVSAANTIDVTSLNILIKANGSGSGSATLRIANVNYVL